MKFTMIRCELCGERLAFKEVNEGFCWPCEEDYRAKQEAREKDDKDQADGEARYRQSILE